MGKKNIKSMLKNKKNKLPAAIIPLTSQWLVGHTVSALSCIAPWAG